MPESGEECSKIDARRADSSPAAWSRNTAWAAIEALRRGGARRVILAVPVAPDDSVAAMRDVADEVVVVDTPPWFFSIGEFYEDFAQTSDEEVVSLLERAAARSECCAAVLGRG